MVPNLYLILGLFVAVGIWLVVVTIIILKALSTYRTLTQGISQKDFATILADIQKHLLTLDKKTAISETNLSQIEEGIKSHLQKIGYVRYNPFGNTGGDQSFCLCLLDDRDDGILITSLHAREQTRLYTKEIKGAKPVEETQLSKEEKTCLQQAIKRR
jgi:hypothetical protein